MAEEPGKEERAKGWHDGCLQIFEGMPVMKPWEENSGRNSCKRDTPVFKRKGNHEKET